MTQTQPISIGLRFQRKDIKTLQMIVDIQRADGKGDIGAFDRALAAATTGEPLIVQCQHPDEATRIAESFVRVGVSRPAVEDLTSPGG